MCKRHAPRHQQDLNVNGPIVFTTELCFALSSSHPWKPRQGSVTAPSHSRIARTSMLRGAGKRTKSELRHQTS